MKATNESPLRCNVEDKPLRKNSLTYKRKISVVHDVVPKFFLYRCRSLQVDCRLSFFFFFIVVGKVINPCRYYMSKRTKSTKSTEIF